MATWREAENYLTSNYKTEKVGDHFYKLVFSLDAGRSQMVFVMGLGLEDANTANLAFFSPFAKFDQISPQTLVDTMEKNPFLGFSRTADWYTLKHIAPLANLDANEIEWPMQYITVAADTLERELGLGDQL
jgi:hypothetical protein